MFGHMDEKSPSRTPASHSNAGIHVPLSGYTAKVMRISVFLSPDYSDSHWLRVIRRTPWRALPKNEMNGHCLIRTLTAMPSSMPLKTKWWKGSTEYQ
jgi:hypothetical protein